MPALRKGKKEGTEGYVAQQGGGKERQKGIEAAMVLHNTWHVWGVLPANIIHIHTPDAGLKVLDRTDA
jgi:hypothetical protein